MDKMNYQCIVSALECCLSVPVKCNECQYNRGAECEALDERQYDVFPVALIEDALALLKEFKPRVMTLDEVKQMGLINYKASDYEEVCYLERIDSKYVTPSSPMWHEAFYDGDDSALDIEYPIMASDFYVHGYVEDYGKTHRCWTTKPTEEMRKNVKWE